MTRQSLLLCLIAVLLALPSPGSTATQSIQPALARLPGPHLWRAHNAAARVTSHRSGTPSASANSGALIETIGGSVPYQSPGSALALGLGDGGGVAEDASGNLYISTGSLGVVLKVDRNSNTTIYAGKPLPTGPAQPSGDGGPASAAVIDDPQGLAVDSSGNLYIADYVSSTIRMVSAGTGTIQTIAGVANNPGHSGDGGPGTSAQLLFPTAVALDGAGNLYIADEGYIRQLNLSTGVIQTILGSGPFKNGSCSLNAANSCPALSLGYIGFNDSGVAANGNALYTVANHVWNPDATNLNNAVIEVDLSTGLAKLVAGGGLPPGTTSNPALYAYYNPVGVALDSQGTIYLTGSGAVYSLTVSNVFTRVAGNDFSTPFTLGDGGAATSAGLYSPNPIAFTPQGNVIFYDTGRVRSFAVGGTISTIAGDGTSNLYGDGGAATAAGLDMPASVTTDNHGNLFISDRNDYAVRRIDSTTGLISTVAGVGNPYAPGSDGTAASASSILPVSTVADNGGNLYVADSLTQTLRKINLKTGLLTTLLYFGQEYGDITGDMVFDGKETIYAPKLNIIVAIDTTGGTQTIIAGKQSPLGDSGDGGPATQAEIGTPAGLALDDSGNLYFSDNSHQVVRAISLATGIIHTVAGISGQVGYSGDGGPGTAATLGSDPLALAYDHNGHLFITDTSNAVIRQLDLTTGIITTAAGTGTIGFAGDGGPATSGLLNYPEGLASDASGNLFLGDTQNDRVRRILIQPAKLSATLTSSTPTANPGETLIFSASFSGLSFGQAPAGSVTFLNGSTSLGTAPLVPGGNSSANYTASLSTTSLTSGNDTISAQYSGDAHYAPVTTNAVSVTVGASTPAFSVAAASASLSVAQGSSGTLQFTITPKNSFTQTISFACDPGSLPEGVSCSFNPGSVTPNGTVPIISTLTISTTGASAASLREQTPRSPAWWMPASGALALLFFSLPSSRRRAWQVWMGALLIFVAMGMTIGCGSSGQASSSGSTSTGTPAGTYSINVTATAGSGASAVTQPLAISLTVTDS